MKKNAKISKSVKSESIGNPMVMMASNPDLISSVTKLIGVVVVTGAIGTGAYFGYQWYQKRKQEGAQDDLGTSLEAQQANSLLQLLHPVSYQKAGVTSLLTNPLQIVDSIRDYAAIVDKNAIIKVATSIKKFDKVNEYYTKLTKGVVNLPDDLRKVLNDTQQKSFYNAITISAISSEVVVKKPFPVYAAPTTTNKLLSTYYDKFFTKVAFSYNPKTYIGDVTDTLIVPFLGKDGMIHKLSVYKVLGKVGQVTGKEIYLLVSQVTTKKPV